MCFRDRINPTLRRNLTIMGGIMEMRGPNKDIMDTVRIILGQNSRILDMNEGLLIAFAKPLITVDSGIDDADLMRRRWLWGEEAKGGVNA